MTTLQVESVAIAKLRADPKNARRHSVKNLDAIKGSLEAFGQQKPIVVTPKGVVIAGNGTLEAAKALGWEDINVIRMDLRGKELRAFALADNRSAELADWDVEILGVELAQLQVDGFDIEAIGFKSSEVKAHSRMEGLTDPDAVPDKVETRCKTGDLWVLGEHRLLCGDSTNEKDVKRLMGAEKAELCFTSPPYADQREYNGGKELSTEHLATFIRASRDNVKLFAVNLGISRKDGEVNCYWDDYIKVSRNFGLKLLSWNVWDKGECGSIGNQTAMFGIVHEWVFIFGYDSKKINRTVPNKSFGEIANHTGNRQVDGSIKKSKDLIVGQFRNMDTIHRQTPQKARDEIDHPARFPVAFPEAYIEACTDAGERVYDAFLGSGSTLIACEKTERRCFGMEIDPHYCDVILKRWEDFTGDKAKRVKKK